MIGIVLACYVLLVATHKGEFWPFSIYPMFSQAGQPWTRVLVRELPPAAAPGDDVPWATVPLSDLPGKAFPLASYGTFQNDLANYVSKTEVWDAGRVRGMRSFLRQPMQESERRLLVTRVRGTLQGDSVQVAATPFALVAPDTTRLNPTLGLTVRR